MSARDWLRTEIEKVRADEKAKRNEPRELTIDDRLGWEAAMDKQHGMHPRTINSVRAQIRAKNPARWMMLQRDLKWVAKELKKMGLNPDDARYIL